MKKALPLIIPIILLFTVGIYSYLYNTTIMVVQTVSNDSLAIGHDRSPKVNDTVTIVGRVVAPPRVNFSGGDNRILTRGANSRTAYIQDTSNVVWSGIIVRQADTVSNTLFDQLDSGMKVRVTGIVQEFPDQLISGVTQIKLDTLSQVQVLPTIKKRPPATVVNVSNFDSLGSVNFLGGEKYEGMYVQLNNVTVGPQSPSGARHIRSLSDAAGNKIYLRDFSNFFSTGPTPSWGWTAWTPPSVGATVNYIRGVIINGGYSDGLFNGGAVYPFVIVPIYPNDLSIGNTPPFISSVARNPQVPKPGNNVQVTCVTVDTLDHPLSVDSVQLFYRINKGTYTKLAMTPSVPIYSATIPAQTLGTLVEYFIKAKDNQGGSRTTPQDTSLSTFFYYVRNSDTMTIKDIQYTPNNGGFSGYNNCFVTTEGIVTADTSDIPAFSFSSPGGTTTSPRRVIIQDPNTLGGWSGIWITGSSTDALVKGQRVRVYGQVIENFSVTTMSIATSGDITVLSSGNPIPGPEIISPAVCAESKIDGDTTAEKWESVFVKFANPMNITCIDGGSPGGCVTTLPLPDTSFRRNFGEIFVAYPGENVDARVELQDGNHSYVSGWDATLANWYNPGLPGNLLYLGNTITSMQGIMYFSFLHYKLVPRKNTDFGTVIGIQTITETPGVFWLRQNYPNPFNPVTQIIYNVPEASEVTLKVYNLLGQEIRTLVNGLQTKGRYSIPFDGSTLASGLYFYILEAKSEHGNNFKDVKKMVLVK